MRNLAEFQAKFPMSRSDVLNVLAGQEVILHRVYAEHKAQPNNPVLRDQLILENNTMRELVKTYV